MDTINVKCVLKGGQIPKYATVDAAGCDLVSTEDVTIAVGERVLVGTGLYLEIPSTHYAMIAGRSGLALKGINAHYGIIDPDFRGEIKVILTNNSKKEFSIAKGDRIAQLVFSERQIAKFVEAATLDSTQRGIGGFGSTGVSSPGGVGATEKKDST